MSVTDKLAQVILEGRGDYLRGPDEVAEQIIGSDWFAEEIRKAKAEALKELSDKFESWGHEAVQEIDLPIWIEDYADEKYPSRKGGSQ